MNRIFTRILGARPEDVRALKDAERDLWALQAREEAAGITEETPEYLALNQAANEAAAKVPWLLRDELGQDLALVVVRIKARATIWWAVAAVMVGGSAYEAYQTADILGAHHVPGTTTLGVVLAFLAVGIYAAGSAIGLGHHTIRCPDATCTVSAKVGARAEPAAIGRTWQYVTDHAQHTTDTPAAA